MRKIKFLLLFISLITIAGTNHSFGFSIHNPKEKADRFENLKSFRADELVKLSAKQFSELTGKKMNLWEKASFKIMKMKMKHDLKKDPDLTLKDYYGSEGKKRLGTGWIILIAVAATLLILLLIFAAAYNTSYA